MLLILCDTRLGLKYKLKTDCHSLVEQGGLLQDVLQFMLRRSRFLPLACGTRRLWRLSALGIFAVTAVPLELNLIEGLATLRPDPAQMLRPR